MRLSKILKSQPSVVSTLLHLLQLKVCAFNSRKIWGFKDGLDDPRVDGEDGEHYARQEDQRQLVDVLHAHKDHQSHESQTAGAIDSHVIQHGCRLKLLLRCFENGSTWHYISLGENRIRVYRFTLSHHVVFLSLGSMVRNM